MKHLHYGAIVIAVSDQLASVFETAAHDLMAAGKSTVWPVAGYRDDRDEVSIQLAIGPGIPFAITDTWLPDAREPAGYDSDSIAFITAEHDSIEKAQLMSTVENVVVYGRFDRTSPQDPGDWSFTGHPSVIGASDPRGAVDALNREGIEVVAMTESGAPGEEGAWSNLYLVGRVPRDLAV